MTVLARIVMSPVAASFYRALGENLAHYEATFWPHSHTWRFIGG